MFFFFFLFPETSETVSADKGTSGAEAGDVGRVLVPDLLSCWVVSLPLVGPGDSSRLLPASVTLSSGWLQTMSPVSSRSSRWLTEKFFLACRGSRFDVSGLSRRFGVVAGRSITWT